MPLVAKSFTSMERTVEATERTIAPRIAGIQPSTMKPGTKKVVILRTMALTTKMNNPKVITVNGKVKRSKIGFMKVLIIPSTIAASNAEVKESTLNPGTI